MDHMVRTPEGNDFELLVISEHENTTDLIECFLIQGGYKVTTVHSGALGLQEIRSKRYLLILVDQDLHDMSGYEVLGQGKEIIPDAEFIVLMEYPSISKALLILSYGAYGYLVRPIEDLGDLLSKIILAREKVYMNKQFSLLRKRLSEYAKGTE